MLEHKHLCRIKQGAKCRGDPERRSHPAEAVGAGVLEGLEGRENIPPKRGWLQLTKVTETKKGRACSGDGEETSCSISSAGKRAAEERPVILGKTVRSLDVCPGSLGGERMAASCTACWPCSVYCQEPT